jgi:hypothetical protein
VCTTASLAAHVSDGVKLGGKGTYATRLVVPNEQTLSLTVRLEIPDALASRSVGPRRNQLRVRHETSPECGMLNRVCGYNASMIRWAPTR